jgi:hypothetical protein
MHGLSRVAALFAMGLPWGVTMAGEDRSITAELRHSNGMTLQVPRAAAVQELADGFRIIPEGSRPVRSSSRIELRLRPGACPRDADALVHEAGNAQISYRIRSEEGGSGGALHVLTAWRQLGNACVMLEHSLQAEVLAKDAFALGWKLIASASLRKP